MTKIVHINEEKYMDEYFDEELALSELLKDGVLFCNNRDYGLNSKIYGQTIVLFVLLNDVFSWGCADAEDLLTTEIEGLYNFYLKDKKCGVIKWACIKRNQKPQGPMVKYMKENGSWDETLEKLPENLYDKIFREDHEKRKVS